MLDLIKIMTVDALTIQTLYPITKEELLSQHASVSEGLDKFLGEHHIDHTVTPVICNCRKTLFAVMDRLKEPLEDLMEANVTEKVTEPTAWVTKEKQTKGLFIPH